MDVPVYMSKLFPFICIGHVLHRSLYGVYTGTFRINILRHGMYREHGRRLTRKFIIRSIYMVKSLPVNTDDNLIAKGRYNRPLVLGDFRLLMPP